MAHSKLFGAACVKAATEIPYTGSIVLENKIVGKPNEQYLVCGGVYQVKEGTFFVMITPCYVPCCLQENFVLSCAEKVDLVCRLADSSELNPQFEGVSGKWLDEDQVHVGDAVNGDDKTKLINLLHRFEGCFAHDLTELGCTDVAEMKIELNSQKPVVCRPYRFSFHERKKVRGVKDEMLQADIIRESASNYSSPIISVRKKMARGDALSRNPIADKETRDPEQYPSVMVVTDED